MPMMDDHCSASESKQWHRTTLQDRAQRAKKTTAFQLITSTSSQLYTDDFQLILRENNSLFPETDKTRTTTNVEYLQFSSQEPVQEAHPWDDRKFNTCEAAVNLTESGELRLKGPLGDSQPSPAKQAQVEQVQLLFYPFRQFFHLKTYKKLDIFSTYHFSLLPLWRLKSSSGKTWDPGTRKKGRVEEQPFTSALIKRSLFPRAHQKGAL